MTRTIGIAAVVAMLLVTPTMAQTGVPTTSQTMDKKAVSKECSTQADAQKLHGKARKTFRSKCKMNGGKAA